MSTSLLVVFLASVGFVALPPRLLDYEWQLGVISALINNGAIALLGFLLVPLAAWIDPGSRRLNARANAFRRWSTAAALGFLLLAPLHGFAAWQALRNAELSRTREFNQTTSWFDNQREVINSSESSQELFARVQSVAGGSALMDAADFSKPLPQLKKDLRTVLEQWEKDKQQLRLKAPAIRPGPPMSESLRLAISSLAYAYVFGFGAGLLRWGPRGFTTIGKPPSVVDEHYYQKLSD
jgi:hypothetical protein